VGEAIFGARCITVFAHTQCPWGWTDMMRYHPKCEIAQICAKSPNIYRGASVGYHPRDLVSCSSCHTRLLVRVVCGW